MKNHACRSPEALLHSIDFLLERRILFFGHYHPAQSENRERSLEIGEVLIPALINIHVVLFPHGINQYCHEFS